MEIQNSDNFTISEVQQFIGIYLLMGYSQNDQC